MTKFLFLSPFLLKLASAAKYADPCNPEDDEPVVYDYIDPEIEQDSSAFVNVNQPNLISARSAVAGTSITLFNECIPTTIYDQQISFASCLPNDGGSYDLYKPESYANVKCDERDQCIGIGTYLHSDGEIWWLLIKDTDWYSPAQYTGAMIKYDDCSGTSGTGAPVTTGQPATTTTLPAGNCEQGEVQIDGVCRDASNPTTCGDVDQTINDNNQFLRIVGGESSEDKEWPWQATIRRRTGGGGVTQNCGGTIISDHWVLTAAHCIDEGLTYFVDLGEWWRWQYLLQSGYSYDCKTPIVHEGYNTESGGTDMLYDIALLETEERIIFSDRIKPACLMTPEMEEGGIYNLYKRDEDFTYSTSDLWATGFGRLNYNNALHEQLESEMGNKFYLQKVNVPYVPNNVCANSYYKAVYNHYICAGGEGGKDSCQGDSGGPLVTRWYSDQWVVVGVVSHGYKCAEPGYPGVYIRVAKFATWIYQHTQTVSNVRLCHPGFTASWDEETQSYSCSGYPGDDGDGNGSTTTTAAATTTTTAAATTTTTSTTQAATTTTPEALPSSTSRPFFTTTTQAQTTTTQCVCPTAPALDCPTTPAYDPPGPLDSDGFIWGGENNSQCLQLIYRQSKSMWENNEFNCKKVRLQFGDDCDGNSRRKRDTDEDDEETIEGQTIKIRPPGWVPRFNYTSLTFRDAHPNRPRSGTPLTFHTKWEYQQHPTNPNMYRIVPSPNNCPDDQTWALRASANTRRNKYSMSLSQFKAEKNWNQGFGWQFDQSGEAFVELKSVRYTWGYDQDDANLMTLITV